MTRSRLLRLLTAAAAAPALLLSACAGAGGPQTASAPAPVATAPAALADTPMQALPVRGPKAEHAMVAAANPLAVEAGLKVLRAGGSAVDAAVAVQAVLGLVEPQSSGLGGGAFMTLYDPAARAVTVYDGRETAPAGATPALFLDPAGKPLPFMDAVLSGRSTGVPGAVAMLSLAQGERGRLPWRDLFGEAERLAAEGFTVSPRLAAMAAMPMGQARQPDAQRYFRRADGGALQAGDTLRNPAYAAFVRRLAAEGPDALLKGETAERIVARLQPPPAPAGVMTAADLAGYRPVKRDALCQPYRVYVVCAPPPPSSGVGLLQALKLLERTDVDRRGPADPVAWLLIAQAQRLMYADRDRYVGDPAFVSVPVQGLLDPAYVAARAALISPEQAGPPPSFGAPPGAPARGRDATAEPGGTTHFVIVDDRGMVVSMTTTVESLFGSGRMVDGFFLNNQLTDFSFSPSDKDGRPAANAVAPGKRPRSSMSPVVVLDRQGRFVAALGSPGGNNILAYNLKTLVAVLDWKLPMQEAVALPNLIARGANVTGEADRFAPGVPAALAARGVDMKVGGGEGSGLHGIIRRADGYEGGADPRREGVARGY